MSNEELQWGSQKDNSDLFIRISLESAAFSRQAVQLQACTPYIEARFQTRPLLRGQRSYVEGERGLQRRREGGYRACRWMKEPRNYPESLRSGPKAKGAGRIYTKREKSGEEGT
jgi:hypothetical protein